MLFLESIKELKMKTQNLQRVFDFKSENVLENEVSSSNELSFRRNINMMLSPANELKFITINDNKDYANDIFNSSQKIFVKGNQIISKHKTNREMKELIDKESKNILDCIFLIENNEEDFKDFIKMEEKPFNTDYFLDVAKHIHIQNNSDEHNLKIFNEELNGGEFIVNFASELGLDDDEVDLYGIDRDVDIGVFSRDRGIKTARRRLIACSNRWADVAVASNDRVRFGGEERDNSGHITTDNYYSRMFKANDYENTINRKILQNNGLLLLNTPFYKINELRKDIRNFDILDIINTDDEYGNLIFVLQNRPSKSKRRENLLRKAEFTPEKLPKQMAEDVVVDISAVEPPNTFRASFVDIDDVKLEFSDRKPSSQYLFEKNTPEDEIELSKRPLQEPKEGHIPTLATSGIVSGRYIDEILRDKVGEEIGFDNIIETKIVKREIEEEEKVNRNGKMVTEVSQKKSNIIVSTTLTTDGDYIELFSNETE